jgi:AcrR family transcriptional regulator
VPQKPYHHGDLRNCLIEAGIELINQEGEKHLSLRKVSAKCGVSQTALYSHFQSKEDLLSAIQDHVTEQFTAVMEEAMGSGQDQNDPRVLIEIGKRYVLFFIRNPHYHSFLFSQPGMQINLAWDGDSSDSFAPFELLKATVARIFGGAMPKERLQDTTISLWAVVHGLSAIATMKTVKYDKNWEDKIEDIIAVTNRTRMVRPE